jgi:hypothetical protein
MKIKVGFILIIVVSLISLSTCTTIPIARVDEFIGNFEWEIENVINDKTSKHYYNSAEIIDISIDGKTVVMETQYSYEGDKVIMSLSKFKPPGCKVFITTYNERHPDVFIEFQSLLLVGKDIEYMLNENEEIIGINFIRDISLHRLVFEIIRLYDTLVEFKIVFNIIEVSYIQWNDWDVAISFD